MRAVICYEWGYEVSGAEIHICFVEVYGSGVMWDETMRRLCRVANAGIPRQGRTHTATTEVNNRKVDEKHVQRCMQI